MQTAPDPLPRTRADESEPSASATRPGFARATGLLWALAYLLLATPRLTSQGLYYDEVHQATAALAFAGSPHVFAAWSIQGIPVLNMPYSGAIKSAIYGLALRATGFSFSILTWRLLGCLFAALGIFLVCSVAARRLSPAAAHVLGFLLATDMTVVLATRHDWGPVALALLLRLAILAVWLLEWDASRMSARWSFLMGLLLGVAVFEKLSSVVVALPVVAAFLLDRRRRSPRLAIAGLGGGLIGGLPLIAVNLHSWNATRQAISLTAGIESKGAERGVWSFLETYADLGSGAGLASWILGRPLPAWVPSGEGLVVLFLCGVVICAGLAASPDCRRLRGAAVFAALYPMVGLAVEALPARTSIHHWVIGTPLQYAAFALALAGLVAGEGRGRVPRGLLRGAFAPALILLVALRLPAVFAIERDLRAGLHSANFDPETTELAAFANRQPDDSLFIATEWGIGNQIFCLSNGRRLAPEVFWSYRGPDDLRAAAGDRATFFLAGGSGATRRPGATARILADARALGDFRETPVPEAERWREVRLWRFDRIPPAADAPARP